MMWRGRGREEGSRYSNDAGMVVLCSYLLIDGQGQHVDVFILLIIGFFSPPPKSSSLRAY